MDSFFIGRRVVGGRHSLPAQTLCLFRVHSMLSPFFRGGVDDELHPKAEVKSRQHHCPRTGLSGGGGEPARAARQDHEHGLVSARLRL